MVAEARAGQKEEGRKKERRAGYFFCNH